MVKFTKKERILLWDILVASGIGYADLRAFLGIMRKLRKMEGI